MVVVVAAEEMEADARGHPSCPPLPLQSVGLGHKGVLQTLHPFAWVVPTGQQETGSRSRDTEWLGLEET